MGELLPAKRESFTVLPRAPSLRGLAPEVTGGVKLPLSGGSWRAYARLRGFSLEEIGRIVYYIVLWNM